MMRLRRASVIAEPSLLAGAATAAECASGTSPRSTWRRRANEPETARPSSDVASTLAPLARQ